MKKLSLLLIVLVAFGLMLTSCDKRTIETPKYHIENLTSDSRGELYADGDVTTFINIRALVLNNHGLPVKDATVNFKSDKGTVTASAITNESGIAVATFDDNGVNFANDAVDFDGVMKVECTVTASVAKSSKQAKVYIKDVPTFAIESLTINPSTVYADGIDTTTSMITATVKDSEGRAIANESVAIRILPDYHQYGFINTFNNFNVTSTTDALGEVRANFMDRGVQADSVKVEAILGENDPVVVKFAISNLPYQIATMTASPNVIYADNDITTNSEIKVVVVDPRYNNVGVANQQVTFTSNEVASVSGSVMTNEAGEAIVTLNDNGEAGTAVITAHVGGVTKTINVEVKALPSASYKLTDIVINPTTILADNDPLTFASVKARVLDGDDYPVAGETVIFRVAPTSTDLGVIEGSAVTDISGIATAKFTDNGMVGDASVTASYNGVTKDGTITIEQVPGINIISMSANPPVIYSDNNITFSKIRAILKDTDGFAVINQQVQFRTDLGNVIRYATTDSTGVAETTFYDNGVEPGDATVRAFVGDVTNSVNVTIAETPGIDTTSGETKLIVGSENLTVDELVEVKAIFKTTDGENVSNGTSVTFVTTQARGFFQDVDENILGETATVTTFNGVAKVYYNAGTLAGDTEIQVSIANGEDGVYTMGSPMTINPGEPLNMVLSHGLQVAEIPVNGDEVSILAKVSDKYGNRIKAGKNVAFTTNLGTITPNVTTDINGEATASFSPGIQAGSARIDAKADSAKANITITVTSDELRYIEFANNDNVTINPRGSGGTESVELTVNLFDMSGNNWDEDPDPEDPEKLRIYFRLLYAPDIFDGGVNINNDAYWKPGVAPELQDSTFAVASNGQARVSVNSGLKSGTIQIEAYKWVNGEKIVASKSNIVVTNGAPANVSIDLEDHSTGTDLGGGFWKVEFGALLTDNMNNPVAHGTVVYFSVTDMNDIPIDWATVEGDGYVENQNADGDSLAGTAYSYLIYHGSHTNEEIKIKVNSATFAGEDVVKLPMQSPQIDMAAFPQHIDFEAGENTTEEDATVITVVTDGQNVPINGTRVTFMSTLGDFIEPPLSQTPIYEGITAFVSGQNGRIDKTFRMGVGEVPPAQGPGAPGQVSATITATIVGTNTSNNITLQVLNYRQ